MARTTVSATRARGQAAIVARPIQTLRAGELRAIDRNRKDPMIGEGLPPDELRRTAISAMWTFPSILLSSFVVAWGAECAQFYISQGLALALLAWIQVLPEFAVEAVIAWHQDVPLMTANFTGALRLLTGLGWPMIWVVCAFARSGRGEQGFWRPIELDQEHAVEVVGLTPALLYFAWIIWKGSLGLWDAGVLLCIYASYLFVLQRIPPKAHEEIEDAGVVPRRVLGFASPWRPLAVVGLFVVGGVMLYLTAHPFLQSMIGLATMLGVSQFVFVQWVAPFLSEFPEFVTTSNWARSRGKAGMALMNMASSNINQWTVLAAMIPIVYSWSLGHPASVPMAPHRIELLLTLLQGALGVVLLANFNFQAYEALGLLLFWGVQFVVPDSRSLMCWAYGGWLTLELVSTLWRPGRLRAFSVFPSLWKGQAARP
jgi:cation:H+ antiporter